MTARVAFLLTALLFLLPVTRANADPISLAAYRSALVNARTEIDVARQRSGDDRRRAIGAAMSILSGVTEVTAGDATYTALPHEPLQALLRDGSDDSLERASGMLGETIAAIGGGTAFLDPAQARSALDAILASTDFRPQPDWHDALLAILRALLGSSDLRVPQVTAVQIATALSGVVTLLLALIAIYATRGLRAKITREAVLAAALSSDRPRAVDHLSAADEAIRRGRLRDALRSLFLAALAGLEERGGLRLDPALTDREILARAAGSARVDDLSSLVELYEPAWFGEREPTPSEVERAADLARRIGS